MRPSFAILAATDALLMFVTLAIGLTIGRAPADSTAYTAAFARHFLLGLGTMLFTCFVHVITFTYFVVSARMAQEAMRAAGMQPEGYRAAADLKRRCARWLLAGVGSILATGAAGAMTAGAWGASSSPHMLIAFAALFINVLAFFAEYQLIGRNVELTDRIFGALPPSDAPVRD